MTTVRTVLRAGPGRYGHGTKYRVHRAGCRRAHRDVRDRDGRTVEWGGWAIEDRRDLPGRQDEIEMMPCMKEGE